MSNEALRLLQSKRAGRWYEGGLKFRCQAPQCSHCCSGQRGEGYVWVTLDEMRALAAYLRLSLDAFTRRFVRQVDGGYSLTEKLNKDCVFLENGGCSVYEARPMQCRTYPFWPAIMRAPETWAREAQQCPGINTGETIDADDIDRQLAQDNAGRSTHGPLDA